MTTTSGFKPQVLRFLRNRRMWSWSFLATRAKATGRSASGSVASSKVKRPRCSSSTQSVPLKCSRTLRRCAAMSSCRGVVAEHVVDEPRGEVEEELAAERLQGPLDAHAVLEDAVEHQVADLVVVLGLGEHALGGVAEGRAAVAAGGVLAVGDLQVGDGLVGDGADGAGQRPLAAAAFAALRAGGLLGGAVDRYNDGCGCFGAHACVPGDEARVATSFTGTQALSFKSKTAYPRHIPRWCSARSLVIVLVLGSY